MEVTAGLEPARLAQQGRRNLDLMSAENTPAEDKVKHRAIFLFLFWSFAFTWGCVFLALWLQKANLDVYLLLFGLRLTSSSTLSFMGNLGPAAAAVMVLSRLGQQGESKILVKEGFAWRIPSKGYFLGILIPVAILVLAIVALVIVSRVPFHWYGKAFGMWIESMIWGSLFRAWGEEIGWRGFLLPRLQSQMNGLEASLLVGLVWWTWHLPVRLNPGHFQWMIHFTYLVEIVSLSVILTWLRNLIPGSLVPVIILHAAFNSGLDTLRLTEGAWYQFRWELYLASAALLMAGFILTIAGKKLEEVQAAENIDILPNQVPRDD